MRIRTRNFIARFLLFVYVPLIVTLDFHHHHELSHACCSAHDTTHGIDLHSTENPAADPHHICPVEGLFAAHAPLGEVDFFLDIASQSIELFHCNSSGVPPKSFPSQRAPPDILFS